MKAAMEQVKAELGSDAVILHTKKYKEGGVLGFGNQEMVEVTAAVEETPLPPRKPSSVGSPAAQPATPVLPPSVLSQYKTHGTAEGVAMASREDGSLPPPINVPDFTAFELTDRGQGNQTEEPENGKKKKKRPRIIKAENPVPFAVPAEEEYEEGEEDSSEEETERRSSGKRHKAENKDQEKIQQLEGELAQMKALLAQVMSKDQPKDVVPLQEALRTQEVEEEILRDMAIRSGAGETLADRASPQAMATLVSYLDQVTQYSDGIQLNRHGVRIVALIGATGVGKTTTLAKIAARFVLERGVSAALITADTYRISAVEQLKTYSDILGLPLDIVYTPAELSKAIRKHRNKDLILIDTAGRSQHNEYQMKELKELLEVNSRIEKHLVMSATTKNKDAAEILSKFSVCEPERIIFTKTDETSSVGLILNLLYENKISLSYFTNGQSVPDDIVPASAEKLAELLLKQ